MHQEVDFELAARLAINEVVLSFFMSCIVEPGPAGAALLSAERANFTDKIIAKTRFPRVLSPEEREEFNVHARVVVDRLIDVALLRHRERGE